MLSRLDQGDLLVPLHEGIFEEPRWRTFLSRLRDRTGADYAALIFRQGDAPMHEATELFAARDVRTAAKTNRPGGLYRLDPAPYDRLRAGRVYRADELLQPGDPEHAGFHRDYLLKTGVRYARFVRMTEPGGASAVLAITHSMTDFSAADGALLSALAPHVAIALRTLAELERVGQRAAIARSALSRSGLSWVALDSQARLVDADPEALHMLEPISDGALRIGSRIPLASPIAASALAEAAAEFARNRDAASRLIRLSSELPSDLLATSARHRPLVALSMPTLVGFLSKERAISNDGLAVLMAAHGLTAREAELALALTRGKSLRTAAFEIGLTIETARNYSKRIFAKTGTRGQTDLVRKLLASVVALA